VQLVNNSPTLQADSVLIDKAVGSNNLVVHLNKEVVEIIGEETVRGIVLRDLADRSSFSIPVDGVFIEIGLIPNSSFAEGVLTLNDKREIVVNCRCETNLPGIFAAGDVTDVPDKQIIVAAGEGAKAALGLSAWLLRMRD